MLFDFIKRFWLVNPECRFFPPIGGGSSTYEIAKSLRFRSGASAYLSRTLGTPTNSLKWTWSGFVKRGDLGQPVFMFEAQVSNGASNTASFDLRFLTDGRLYLAQEQVNVSTQFSLITNATYLDPSAWYHVVLAYDSAQATAANRMLLYVNGVQVTSFSSATYPSLNAAATVNSAVPHRIGYHVNLGTPVVSDGYLSEINFIDGLALTPASFGYLDAATNSWRPKKYTGTYGTNGFYIPFNDGTNLTTLGQDRSGNGNNWTCNNISLTAGATYDWMNDTPTNNYCVLNQIGNYIRTGGTSFNWTLSDANLSLLTGDTTSSFFTGTIAVTQGKWYWEYLCTSGLFMDFHGICNSNAYAKESATPYVTYWAGTGAKYINGVGSAYGAQYGSGDVVGFALDVDALTLTCYKNGVSQGVINIPYVSEGYVPYFTDGSRAATTGATSGCVNFGQRPFAYTPPTGFKALCTKNLPEPGVAAKNPKAHFDVKTRVGTGAVATVSGLQFPPGLVWPKCRSNADSHNLYDVVRGATKLLISNSNNAEATFADALTAFTSDGYTLGADTSSLNVNANTKTYVDWLWKAGGAAVANNAGSIASQVSVNQAAGFSIVSYTGLAGGVSTVGHGLGVAPKLIIIKNRGAASNWVVMHDSLGWTQGLLGISTVAATTSAFFTNNTAPTSSVFTINNYTQGTDNLIAYCFAEIPGFSKIGSYIGNGSADGPFVYCGFKPSWILFKRADVASNWRIKDTARNPQNPSDATLFPNLSAVETIETTLVDCVSNGFKIRASDAEWNASGGTYIFMAIADQTLKYANAR